MSKKAKSNSVKARSDRAKAARTKTKQQSAARNNKGGSPLNMKWIVGGAIAVALIAIAISMIQSTPGVDSSLVAKYESIPSQRNLLGNPEAPVTIQIWEDFL